MLRSAFADLARSRRFKPSGAARRLLAPQHPRGVELFLAMEARAVARAFARKLEALILPKLHLFAKPEETHLDATDHKQDDLLKDVRRAGHSFNDVAFGHVSDKAAQRAIRHSKREFDRIGLKLLRAEPHFTPFIDRWRMQGLDRIKSLQLHQVDKVEKVLREGGGRTVTELQKEMRRQLADVTESQATLIARSQVIQLNSRITHARQAACGIEEGIWTSSNDERVRHFHKMLDGKRFRLDSPPVTNAKGERNLPGMEPNCRCVTYPILPELGEFGLPTPQKPKAA